MKFNNPIAAICVIILFCSFALAAEQITAERQIHPPVLFEPILGQDDPSVQLITRSRFW